MSRLNDDTKSSVNTTLLSNASDIIRATSLPNATNQDFICLLLGERRHKSSQR